LNRTHEVLRIRKQTPQQACVVEVQQHHWLSRQLARSIGGPEAREKVFIEIHEDGEVPREYGLLMENQEWSGSTFKIKCFAQVIVLPQLIAALECVSGFHPKPHWDFTRRWAFGHRKGAEQIGYSAS